MLINPRSILGIMGGALVSAGLTACGGSSDPGVGAPQSTTTSTASISSASLVFPSTVAAQSSAAQSVLLTSSGNAPLIVAGVSLAGNNPGNFSQTNTCGTTVAAGATCSIAVVFTPVAAGSSTATLNIADNGAGSPQTVMLSGIATAVPLVASLSATSLTYAATVVGSSGAPQMVTLTNSGSTTMNISGISIAGAAASSFTETNNCGLTLPAAASCSTTVTFTPVSAGVLTATLSLADDATGEPQAVTLTGTGSVSPFMPPSVDCSVSIALCPSVNLQGDPLATGGFHGYADPSMRKDPNSTAIYFAYSWPHTLTDGTHVVDLHLAASLDGGSHFVYVGPLYQSSQSTQNASMAYAGVNDSSTETIDLLPIALTGPNAGQTLWVQAHQSYLVAPTTAIYGQLAVTNLISVTAVQLAQPAVSGAGTALLALSAGSTPEARLAAAGTDASRQATQALFSLSPATQKCSTWGQPALWFQTGVLYLSLECAETPGNGNIDANELAHFVYSTAPTGNDASLWQWTYVGEFATSADAAKLGTVEDTSYAFFTEPQFVATKSGQLAVLLTPSVFAPQGATQPVIQYGCRLIPVTLTATSVSLGLDATSGAPSVLEAVTENDLYTSPNEGPAACTYDSASSTGIVMGRKYENDPMEGFYVYPVSSGLAP